MYPLTSRTWLRIGSLLFVALLFSCFMSAESACAAKNQNLDTGSYLIGLGDIITVQVWKQPEVSQKLTVRLDGRISLPLVGDIMAAGKSPETLSQDIEKKLKIYITDPSVSVILEQSTSRRYYVIGKVAKPGEFTIDTPLTIIQVIARAGGFQEWAKKDKIVIIRRQNGRETLIPFDYESFTAGQNVNQNIEIAPGDTVIVP